MQAMDTPKQFGGTALPADTGECKRKRGVDALIEDTAAQIKALKARLLVLEDAKVAIKRMRANVKAAAAFAEGGVHTASSFAATPLPRRTTPRVRQSGRRSDLL